MTSSIYTMHLLNISIKLNPFLMRLTKGESSLDWFSALTRHWLYLWMGICLLIGAANSPLFLVMLAASSFSGLPLSVLVIVVPLALLVFTGTQLTLRETQSEGFALLRLTNISRDTIFWNLIIGTVYRTRRWLTWIIGGCPLFIYLICSWSMFEQFDFDKRCYVSPLGNSYCYPYVATAPAGTILGQAFWCLSITMSIVGVFDIVK